MFRLKTRGGEALPLCKGYSQRILSPRDRVASYISSIYFKRGVFFNISFKAAKFYFKQLLSNVIAWEGFFSNSNNAKHDFLKTTKRELGNKNGRQSIKYICLLSC